ncbi:MAG: tRNA pseudouridine(55) synthase TruB [Synergistaceae bacterium]|nr:tRNA pseudouridine(55) synthase TruB [Synergistaceae bacterium]
MPLSGILPLNKSEGLRSTHCVQQIRHILGRGTKTGHGGTLDSTASGVLIILAGQATRLSNFIMELPKSYQAEVSFGAQTSTDDASGEVILRAPREHVTNEAIDAALCGFMGWRMQSPPAVSAAHVDGERAHALAREGRGVVPDAKAVCFSSIRRTSDIDADGKVSFRIDCRKGTYIRSFARDLGLTMGSAAHLSALERVSSGPFRSAALKSAEELFEMGRRELEAEILPISALSGQAATYAADEAAFDMLSHGRRVQLHALSRRSLGEIKFSAAKIVVGSEKIFSICAAKRHLGSLELAPEVNIILSGGCKE